MSKLLVKCTVTQRHRTRGLFTENKPAKWLNYILHNVIWRNVYQRRELGDAQIELPGTKKQAINTREPARASTLSVGTTETENAHSSDESRATVDRDTATLRAFQWQRSREMIHFVI